MSKVQSGSKGKLNRGQIIPYRTISASTLCPERVPGGGARNGLGKLPEKEVPICEPTSLSSWRSFLFGSGSEGPMKERVVAMEKTRSLENLHELRLMALLLDVIREKGRMEAADLLGVNYKTLARAVETGSLSTRMSHALDRYLLSQKTEATARQQERIEALEQRVETLEQKIESGLGEVRTFVESQVKAFGDEHVRALRQLERRVAEVGAGQGSGSGANAVRKPVGNTTFRRKYPELVTREPAPDDEEVYGAAWPLVEEWRRLRDGHPNDGRSLSWLVTEERILNLELAMA